MKINPQMKPIKPVILTMSRTTALRLLEAIQDTRIRPMLWGNVKDLEDEIIKILEAEEE